MTKTPYLFTVATWLLATTAIAQELPQAPALTNLLSGTTPPFWAVTDLEVVATSRGGDAARPTATIRFEADAAPEAPLFAEASREGPFILVTPTESQGNVRRLYGYFDLTYAAGQWNGPVVIENPVDAFGQPRDMFAAPTLVLGTEDAETRLAALRDNDVAGEIARHETALSDLTNEHQRALTALQAEHSRALTALQAEHAQALGQTKSRQAAEISEAETEASNALTTARANAEKSMSDLRLQYETQMSKLTSEQEPLIAAAEAERAKVLADEQAKADAALDALRAEHAARRGEVIETQRQELAELETRLATERVSLQRQLETAQDTITLQQELLAAMEARAAGAEQVLAAFNAARETRRTFYARLPKDWSGQVVCRTQDNSYNVTWPVSFLFDEFTTTGFTGLVSLAKEVENRLGSGFHLTLTAADETLSLPMTMRAQSGSTSTNKTAEIIRFLGSYDITVSPDGLMTSSFDRPVSVENVRKVATCNMRLGVRES